MTEQSTLVWIAGTSWDSVPGTDKRLVGELTSQYKILWVDPPIRATMDGIFKGLNTQPEEAAPGIWRLPIHTLPGITRPMIRSLTASVMNKNIRRAVAEFGASPAAVVVSFPIAGFPDIDNATKVLLVTDDWLNSAQLTGFATSHMEKMMKLNLGQADVVAAVTPTLLEKLGDLVPLEHAVVLPNGCPDFPVREPDRRSRRTVGLVGQLNERLDLNLLEAVQQTRVNILVVGPRTDSESTFSARLDAFLAQDNVLWVGEVPAEELPDYLEDMSVGITPYADTEFNHASFPLKTLEYLSAGLPVVANDLPAVRWLNTKHITTATGAKEFAQAVVAHLDSGLSVDGANERRKFASKHSWSQRALDFAALIKGSKEGAPSTDALAQRPESSKQKLSTNTVVKHTS